MRATKPVLVAAIISSSLALGACCTTPGQPRLPIPPPVQYPSVKAGELTCLTDRAYLALVERDSLCRARVHTLEDIIRTTHQ